MPGILYHLSFAEEVYRNLVMSKKLDKVAFMAGNLIPDLTINKKESHYRIPGTVDGFEVPNLEEVKKDLFDLNNALKLGIFCHLYLDYYFIEHFLIPEFIWDKENDKITNPRNKLEWNIKTFWSHDGIYGAYTQINELMIRDGHVSMQTVRTIPEILPQTGIPVFDERREKTWKAELEEYLSQHAQYTGEILDYERLWNAIESITKQFIDEISK